MKNFNCKSESATRLRQKAEELLKKKSSKTASHISEIETLKLIHELEVHQIELELQKEELRRANKLTKVAGEKYVELFDFAPTGYFTLSQEGKIFELNLFGSKMLGKERQFLKNNQFGFFVSEDTKPIFNHFLNKAFNSKTRVECEITLSTTGNSTIYVHLAGSVNDNGEQCFVTMVDITERKLAEETLRESELKFRTVADNTCDWEYLQDEYHRIIYMSPSCTRITGYTPNEFISNPVLLQKIVNPEDVDLFVSHFDNIFSYDHRNDIGELDFRILKKDSTIVNIHHICRTLYDKNNKYIGRRVSNRDTTERKQAQDALQKSEALYRNLLERLPDGVYKSTHEGRFVDVNPAMVNMLGYESKEDLLSIDIKTQLYFEPTDRESLVLQEKLEEMGVYRLKKKDGSEIWVEDHGWYDLDENGNIIYHEGIMRDVTDRKKAEETLQNERLLLRTLIDNIPDSIYVKDLTCRKTLANLEEVRYMGAKSESEILGKNDFDVYPKELAEKFLADDQAVMQTGKPVLNREEYILDEKKQKRYLLSSKLPLHDKDGQIIGLVGIGHDITNRKLAELEIKLKNEQLIQANIEKDKFFSIIAHDLRSPFQTLLGYTRMMVEDLPTLSHDEIQKMAVNMRNSANKLFSLLENLLEWSLIRHGVTGFKPVSFILLNGLVPIIELVRTTATKKTISISYDVPEDLRVVADVQMFESLMRNLVFNAVKFTRKGGNVTIAAKALPGNSVEISVKDTGIGMNKTIIDNLFLLDNETHRKGTEGEPSTGLGLIICKDFIDKHGGKIWVESEEGKGSTFCFMLPKNK